MGQYHRIYNVTKNETFKIGGAKLWEQTHSATAAALLLLLSNSNGRGGGDFNVYPKNYDKPTPQEKAAQAIVNNVSGRWAGDQILVQGDYANDDDKAFINLKGVEFVDITREVCDALLIADDGDNSDVVQAIESEVGCGAYSSIKGRSMVEKVESKDRNGGKVLKYVPSGFEEKPKKRASKAKLKAVSHE